MLSRAQKLYPVAYKGQASGILTSVDGSRLTLAGEDGSTQMFTIGSDTAFYRHDSENATTLANIKPFTQVIVLASGGRALYVEQMDDAERLEKTSGEMVTVDESERVLYVKVGTRVETIPYESGTSVLDRTGASVGISALDQGMEVDIYRETFSETKRAVRIELKSAPVNKQGKGRIVSVQPGAIEILDDGAELTETWAVAAAPVISRQGSPATLADLRGGDIVSYTVANGVITQITVETGASRTVTGLFDGFSADKNSIIYVVNGKKEVSDLAVGATLEIPGFAGATWEDLYKDDKLELTLDGNDKVTSVKVVDRNIVTVAGATIINLTDNALTFRNPKGGVDAVELSDKTRIEANRTAMSLKDARTLFIAGRKITITYSEDQAIVIRFAYSHTGTLTALDTTGKRIVVKIDDTSSVTIPYDTPAVQIYGKTGATLADLKVGDKVTVQLDQNLDKALIVKVHKIVQMQVASVDTSVRKARLTSPAGVTSEYLIPSDASVLDESGKSLTLAQLGAGRTVNVEFAGSELVGLQTVIVKVGKILSIAPGAVSFAEYGGAVQDIALGASYKIVKNGATSTSTAALSANDRVEIRTNEQGEYVITVIAPLVKTFWRYDAAANEIQVRRANLSDPYQYKLTADTIVTSGGQQIEVTSLKTDDKIALYIHGGKLLEVEKQ
jgi:Cu/Ag efflux protein CusF